MTFSRDEMLQHAQAWIAAWNRRDVDAVIAAFAPDARFRSPFAGQLTGSATIDGREAIEAYWRQALERIDHLHFRLLAAVCDAPAQRMAVHYEATLGDTTRRACEIFVFRNGMKVEAEALYGDTHPLPADASHPVIV